MPVYVLKPFVQQPLMPHNYRSRGKVMCCPEGTKVMVHHPSLVDYLVILPVYSGNLFLVVFLGGDLSGRLLRRLYEWSVSG